MYDVFDETPPTPPAMAATESTTRICWVFGGVPSSSRRPASAPIAVIVPMVSKKSASISVKISSTADTTPTALEGAERLNVDQGGEVRGVERPCPATSGTVRLQPVGL